MSSLLGFAKQLSCCCKDPFTDSDTIVLVNADAAAPQEKHSTEAIARKYDGVVPHKFPGWKIFDVNLFEDPKSLSNLDSYFRLCADSPAPALLVTLSCFAHWAKHGKTNEFAKVIPALRRDYKSEDEKAVRVIFFDDNIDLDGGLATSEGICNLRDLETGDFVEFALGKNGFTRSEEYKYTLVHHSTEYSNILVKANILDAMYDDDYFSTIIKKYASPGERILVYMDVNSAIVCNDTAAGKSMSSIIVGTMQEYMLITPFKATEVSWEGGSSAFKLEKTVSLKKIVKKMAISNGNPDRAFEAKMTEVDMCESFLKMLLGLGEVRWAGDRTDAVSLVDFRRSYNAYLEKIKDGALDDGGLAKSWFKCWEAIKADSGTVVLNSFGVDTLEVVQKTVADERAVVQVTVNWNLWGERDSRSFEKQFTAE